MVSLCVATSVAAAVALSRPHLIILRSYWLVLCPCFDSKRSTSSQLLHPSSHTPPLRQCRAGVPRPQLGIPSAPTIRCLVHKLLFVKQCCGP
uniref:Uncharacterized protein n=1 Tax=Helianthus annuus TaxID=4232 RepID=A0A251V2B0_HELAN